VQEDRDVVELRAAAAVASGVVFADVAADDEDIEAALVRADARRGVFLPRDHEGVDVGAELGGDDRRDGAGGHEQHRERGRDQREHAPPGSRLGQLTVSGYGRRWSRGAVALVDSAQLLATEQV
jgi:hypothetical protein